jgi:hypothetical protein
VLNGIELLGFSEAGILISYDQFSVEFLLVWLVHKFIGFSRLDECVDNSAGIVVALEGPAEWIFGGFE